jgi:GntR family transcriptional regulator of arabinose operon
MNRIPKYQQIMDWIHKRIESGELRVGDRLETEAELSDQFHFSRQTVRQALANLEQEGMINRIQGSGSYVKSAGAWDGGLQLSRSVTIISSYTDSYIFPRILQSMARVLQEAGYSTRIIFTGNRRETEKNILSDLIRSGSRDPLIAEPVTSGLPNPNLIYYRELRQRGIPILFFNTYYPDCDIPHVSLDDEAAGRMAAEHLIHLGHRRIGCVFKNDDGQGLRRYQGYQEALISAGIPLEEKYVCWIDTEDMKEMLRYDEWILRRLRGCTAAVCYNDEVANMLTQLCQDHQIRIPQKLSIASIDNSRLTQLNPVPLTSVSHPMEELGAKAAENLLGMIRNPNFDASYEFAPNLTVRDSTMRIQNPRA